MTGDSTQGRYFINTTTSTGTHPFSTGYYVLENFGNLHLAFKYSGCEMKVRMHVNATWTNWVTYYTASEIDSKLSPVQKVYTVNGLTVTCIKSGHVVDVVIGGNVTANLDTASAYVTLCTVADGFIPAKNHISYKLLNASIISQVNINSTGAIQLGFTRNLSGTSVSIPSGTNLYATFTYISK